MGCRNLVQPYQGFAKSKQYAETNPNCTKVRVTGYLNWFMICFPVLEDTADEAYHSAQRKMKRIMEGVRRGPDVDGGSVGRDKDSDLDRRESGDLEEKRALRECSREWECSAVAGLGRSVLEGCHLGETAGCLDHDGFSGRLDAAALPFPHHLDSSVTSTFLGSMKATGGS